MIGTLLVAGEKRLAYLVGAGVSGRSLARLTAMRASPGWLVRGRQLLEWRFEGVTEESGSSFLYGPYCEGETLEASLAFDLAAALPRVRLLVEALVLLTERSVPLFPLQTDAVLFTPDGAVLFLPPEVLKEIRGLRTYAMNRDSFEAVNHPDLKGEPLASFSIAAILYRLAVGRFPFGGGTAEEIHEEIRKREVLPPERAAPGVTAGFSAQVMSGLRRGPGPAVSLESWQESVDSWVREPPVRRVSAEEGQRIRREAETRDQEAAHRFRRRVFWEKNWKRALIIAAAVAAVGILSATVLKGILAPRLTHGYTPEQVVRAFYSGMNSLDHAIMAASVTGKAGSQEISEVTNLYVISRVTLGYEGRSGVVSAEEWDKNGRPPLDPRLTVYGVTGLSLTEEHGAPSPVFLARYEKWTPVSGDEEGAKAAEARARFSGTRVTDRLFLKKDRGDWVIFRIDRLQAVSIPPSPRS